MSKINVLIVEDHPLTRQTLAYQIKKLPNINLLASLEDGLKAVEFCNMQAPDIVLMDIDMPVMNGIDAAVEIKKKQAKTKIIMLTNHKDRLNVLDAFNVGAAGYCVKDIKIQELSNIIEIVQEGGIWIDSKIAQFVFEVFSNIEKAQKEAKKPIDFDISQREKEVLKLIADGLSNDEIAEKLFISRNTVKNHVASIIEKLSVKDRTQAAIFAIKNNMLD